MIRHTRCAHVSFSVQVRIYVVEREKTGLSIVINISDLGCSGGIDTRVF